MWTSFLSLPPNSTYKTMWELFSSCSWLSPSCHHSLYLIWFSGGGFALNSTLPQLFPRPSEFKWCHVFPFAGHFSSAVCSLKICWASLCLGSFSNQLQTCIVEAAALWPFLPLPTLLCPGRPPARFLAPSPITPVTKPDSLQPLCVFHSGFVCCKSLPISCNLCLFLHSAHFLAASLLAFFSNFNCFFQRAFPSSLCLLYFYRKEGIIVLFPILAFFLLIPLRYWVFTHWREKLQ